MNFTTEDVQELIKTVAIQKWYKERKLLRRRPIEYNLTKIKENDKKECLYAIDFENSMVDNTFTKELIFTVNETTFANDEYNFSEEWQQLLNLRNMVQSK